MYLAYWKVVQEKDEKPILTESSGTLGVLEGLVVSGVRCRQYLLMNAEIEYQNFVILPARRSLSGFEQDRFAVARCFAQ